MKNRLFSVVILAAMLTGVFVRCRQGADIAANGTEILVPVYVQKKNNDAFPYKIALQYHGVLPPSQIDALSGTLVARRENSGIVSFVRLYSGTKPLRPKEILLRYSVRHPFGIYAGSRRAKVNFAGDVLPTYSAQRMKHFDEITRKMAVKYAVLKVGNSGRAALVGLADTNGVPVLENGFGK